MSLQSTRRIPLCRLSGTHQLPAPHLLNLRRSPLLSQLAAIHLPDEPPRTLTTDGCLQPQCCPAPCSKLRTGPVTTIHLLHTDCRAPLSSDAPPPLPPPDCRLHTRRRTVPLALTQSHVLPTMSRLQAHCRHVLL